MLDFDKIEPSILNQKEVDIQKLFQKFDIKYVHIDIMDWYFVKNLSNINPFFLGNLDLSSYKLHLHFMVEDVSVFFDYYTNLENIELVSFHLESKFFENWSYNKFIEQLKEKNIKVGLAINPDSDIPWKDILDKFDFILFMSVFPWKWWQKFINSTIDKIKFVRENFNKKILVDGWVNDIIFEKIKPYIDRAIMWSFLFNKL